MSTNIMNSALPTWDSFEAVFFVVAGFSVGIVFGVLFPSIWRSFRRSFRKQSHYAPRAEKWDKILKSKIKILSEENLSNNEEEGEGFFYIHIFEAFTAARYYFQIGDTRKAISLYIEILTYENVSKQDTNRALFELSQVYSFIGLTGRAFDTAYELLNRKPNSDEVLVHILKMCAQNFEPEKLNLVLNIYKGVPDINLRRSIAHIVTRISEIYLEKNEIIKAIDYARFSVKWDRTSGRALIMLWETTSKQFWQMNTHDKKIKWLSFAADLEARAQISFNSKVSPAAGAEYLSALIEQLLSLTNSLENYFQVEKEFKTAFNWEKFSLPIQKKLVESIFYAVILLQKKQAVNSNADIKHSNFSSNGVHQIGFNEILSIITNNQQDKILEFLNYNTKYETYILFGFLAHECAQCHTFFSQFLWQCSHCGLEESLLPVNRLLVENS